MTTTYDTGHDTAAKRLTLAQHKMTLTLSTPEWVDEDENFYVELTVDAAATSVVKLFGARANYVFRAMRSQIERRSLDGQIRIWKGL